MCTVRLSLRIRLKDCSIHSCSRDAGLSLGVTMYHSGKGRTACPECESRVGETQVSLRSMMFRMNGADRICSA
jgi:hypothetical protein